MFYYIYREKRNRILPSFFPFFLPREKKINCKNPRLDLLQREISLSPFYGDSALPPVMRKFTNLYGAVSSSL